MASSTSASTATTARLGPRLELLGVPVDRCTREQALAVCAAALRAPGEDPPLQVVTLNPEMVMRARRESELALAVRGAGLVLADGMGVVWAARRVGSPLPERIPGVDFLGALCSLEAVRPEGVFLLGAGPGVAEAAGRRLVERHPGLRLAGCASGSPAEAEASALVQQVRESGARLLAVAFGVPAQEIWLGRHLQRTGCRVGIGVGGSLDYLSGRVPRAPEWLRRAGLEWSFRLLRQPRRLPRMVRGSAFFLAVGRQGRSS
ncbi:MAG: WecB/TagA/CpsF family glycosyltransferase [Candidatus Dormibacteria bacterium]